MRFLILLLLMTAICSTQGQNLEFRSVTTYSSDMADVWGYADEGSEYALVGYEDGFSIVDVTDPDNPEILHDLPGPNTYWRDIKTYGHYAYGVHEDVGFAFQGLVIMDLSLLPEELPVTFWTNSGNPDLTFTAAHNIFIDENGIAYLTGHNVDGGGVLMVDVASNPTNPSVVGQYTERYVHDCFARNDTLWTAEVYSGQFAAIDVSNKSNPVVLARQNTPLSFTHNIWISDDGNTAFTTDERTGAFLASYDVSDIHDIKELDRYRSGPNVIVHNAFTKDEFVVVSWYAHGVIVLDATFPDEMVEVGRFDSSPNYPGPGFHGAWGVYPYLPSGNMLVTDIEEGLIVLSPTYKNATHVRGIVKNANTGFVVSGAMVEINGPGGDVDQMTDLNGTFKRGQVNGGTFNLLVSKPGFEDKEEEFSVADGETIQFEIELVPISYTVSDTIYSEVIAGEAVEICDENTNGVAVDYAFVCGGETNSEVGSWTVSNTGCIEYTANAGSADETDVICLVVQDSQTDEFNVNAIIVNILSATVTSTTENAFRNGSFSLLQNPVRNQLVVQNHGIQHENLEYHVFDVNGRILISRINSIRNQDFQIPVDRLNNGLYILSVQSGDDNLGFIKFIKQ